MKKMCSGRWGLGAAAFARALCIGARSLVALDGYRAYRLGNFFDSIFSL